MALDAPPVFWARAIEERWETRCLALEGAERKGTDWFGRTPSIRDSAGPNVPRVQAP